MAGTDRPMNSFATVTDAAYVYVEDVDGNQVKINKSWLSAALKAELNAANHQVIYAKKNTPITFKYGDSSGLYYITVGGEPVRQYFICEGSITYLFTDSWFKNGFSLAVSDNVFTLTQTNWESAQKFDIYKIF